MSVDPFVAVVAVLVFVVASAIGALAFVIAAWAVQRATGGTLGWTAAAVLAVVAASAWLALVLASYAP